MVRSRLWHGQHNPTRPHTALVAAGNGLWQSIQGRRLKPAIAIGSGSSIGLAGLILYNNAVFGSPPITAGYGSSFASRASSLDVLDYVGNVALAFVHIQRGLSVYLPFLVLLIPGLRTAWKAAPAWVRGSAIGGVLYLLLQFKANRCSGGEGFWGYRYPPETLAAAPLLMLSYVEWARKQSELVRRAFTVLLVSSVAMTAFGAVYF